MLMKNDFNSLQSEIKKLSKLKESHNDKMTKYENEIFPAIIEKYYKYKLSLINCQMINKKDIEFKKEIEINKQLYSIEKSDTTLGNYYDIIFNFFNLLRQDEKIIVNILINSNKEYQDLLINFFSLIFFDNVFHIDDNNGDKEIKTEKILNKILEILIEKELDKITEDSSSLNNYSQFLNDSLASKIIKNFIKFEEVQNYLKNIFSEIILDILETENKNAYLEPNRIRDNLFPVKKILEEIEEINELDKFKNNKTMSSKFNNKKNKKIKIDNLKSFKKRNTLIVANRKKNNSQSQSLNASFDKSFRETIVLKNYSTNVFFNENEITNILYNGLTHSRLIYSTQKQKIFFNNEEKNMEIYTAVNLDKFLGDKNKNPEINHDYSKYELSKNELNYRYKKAGKYNKYMENFYYNQYKQLKKDKDKSYSNMSFLKSMKDNYQNVEAILNQYKINFEKIKYFIDKMIYKILNNNENKIPFCIKNIVHTINNYFKKKEKKIQQIDLNGYIFEFFIGKIIIPFLTNEEIITIILGQKIDKETISFLFYFSKIIKKIFRSNFYDSLDKNFTIFNIYICEILPYINLIISNFLDEKINFNAVKKNQNETFFKIIKHDSLIINENIIRIIIDYLMQNNNKKIKKLFETNKELNKSFKLIEENYKDIIQQLEENKESEENNIFGSPFLILIKQEFSKNNKEKNFSLSTSDEIIKDNNDILSKIKYSLIKFFELIPSDFFLHNNQLIKNKSKIKIFEEIKNIFMKQYINNNLIEKEIENVDSIISFIWYLEYFLKFNNQLSEEYILNDFEKLFNEINLETKNEIINYQNDLSEYDLDNLINNNINLKINSMNNMFIYYSQNRFTYMIKNSIFNNFKEELEIYIYEKNNRQYLFFEKLKNDPEMDFVKYEIFNNIYEFIEFFSEHIIKENIIRDFEEIENKYKKKLSLIDNINNFFESFLTQLKKYVIKELYQQKEENGGIKNEIINLEKEEIENIINIIEELIDEEIYKRLWKHQKSKEDEDLDDLYEKLSKKNINEFSMNSKYINEEIFQNIINLMKSKYNINNFRTPMNKIKCIESIYKILNKSLIIITGKFSDYSVDDIFPIFVYFLTRAKLELLHTNLNFIKLLIRKKHLMKSSGFALTQLEMGIHYLKNM